MYTESALEIGHRLPKEVPRPSDPAAEAFALIGAGRSAVGPRAGLSRHGRDPQQTLPCTYLSALLPVGLILTACDCSD